MGNTGQSESRDLQPGWDLACSAEVVARLGEVFSGETNAMICRKLSPLIDVSEETIRRYMKSGKPSLAFMVAVSLTAGVRLDWLCAGKGAKTEDLERRRIIESIRSECLISEMLSRVPSGELVLIAMPPESRRDPGSSPSAEPAIVGDRGFSEYAPHVRVRLLKSVSNDPTPHSENNLR